MVTCDIISPSIPVLHHHRGDVHAREQCAVGYQSGRKRLHFHRFSVMYCRNLPSLFTHATSIARQPQAVRGIYRLGHVKIGRVSIAATPQQIGLHLLESPLPVALQPAAGVHR